MDRVIAFALFASLALATASAHAKAPTWSGHVGTAAVVAELEASGQAPYGRYFYVRHGVDITLQGKREGKAIRLHEGRDDDRGANWTLTSVTASAIDGTWSDGKRMLPVHLDRFDPASIHDAERNALLHDNAYDYLRVVDARLRPARAQVVGAYRLRWYAEPKTQVELFRVEAGYAPDVLARVNRVLAERQWKQVADAADCLAQPEGDYTPTTTLRRIDATIISVSLFSSAFCGGAHPDAGDDPLNLDPRTGRELELEDVLWLGSGTPPRIDGKTHDAFFAYRDKVFAPWLVKTLARHYPKDMHDDADECDYTSPDVWNFPSWYVVKDGIHVGAVFPRVSRNCDDPDFAVIPWRDVDAHPGAVRIAH